jgi:hypothetical protein
MATDELELEHVPTVAELAKGGELAKLVGGSEKSPIFWLSAEGAQLINAIGVRNGLARRAHSEAHPRVVRVTADEARLRALHWSATSFVE